MVDCIYSVLGYSNLTAKRFQTIHFLSVNKCNWIDNRTLGHSTFTWVTIAWQRRYCITTCGVDVSQIWVRVQFCKKMHYELHVHHNFQLVVFLHIYLSGIMCDTAITRSVFSPSQYYQIYVHIAMSIAIITSMAAIKLNRRQDSEAKMNATMLNILQDHDTRIITIKLNHRKGSGLKLLQSIRTILKIQTSNSVQSSWIIIKIQRLSCSNQVESSFRFRG